MSSQAKKPAEKQRPTPAGVEPASWGRRFAALFIDWIVCLGVALFITKVSGASELTHKTAASTFLPLGVFWVESAIGTITLGGSLGQMILGLRVLYPDGSHLRVVPALLRQALVCIVVPPLIYRPDGRGLHDMVVDSATYRVS